MSTCEHPECPGHLGRFNSCRDMALYELTLDSGQDEDTGSSDFQGWHALFIMAEPERVTIDGAAAPSRTVTVPAGNYVLTCASSGAVIVGTYETEAEARTVFDVEVTAYQEWCDGNDF